MLHLARDFISVKLDFIELQSIYRMLLNIRQTIPDLHNSLANSSFFAEVHKVCLLPLTGHWDWKLCNVEVILADIQDSINFVLGTGCWASKPNL